MPIQGAATADIMKLAMNNVFTLINQKYKDFAKMILQIHDELVFEVPSDSSEKLQQFAVDVKDVFESVVKLKVPLLAEVLEGDNWEEMEEMVFDK